MLPHSTGSILNVDERLFGSGWIRHTTRAKEHYTSVREKAVKTMIMSVGAFEFGLCDIVPTVIATTVIKETLTSKSVHIYTLIARHPPPIHPRVRQQWPSPTPERISHYEWNGTLNFFSPNDINANLRQSTIMSSVRICIRWLFYHGVYRSARPRHPC